MVSKILFVKKVVYNYAVFSFIDEQSNELIYYYFTFISRQDVYKYVRNVHINYKSLSVIIQY